MANRVPSFTVSKTYGSQALVVDPQRALVELQKILIASQEAMHNQGVVYHAIAEKWRLEIAGLRAEGTMLDTKVHRLEDELQGTLAAQKAMASTLQMRDSEISTLRSAIQEVSEQHHQVKAQLEILEREKAQIKKSMEEQEVLIVENAKRATTNELLQKKMQERSSLEAELRKTNEAMQQERSRIAKPVSLGAAVLVGLVTGGVGGFLMGLGGGQIASSVVTDSANCPCMTVYHAKLASIQKRLDLVKQEIDRLKKVLAES
jgi:uncharacterized phage infection (PIP) family protein YhgE